MNKATLSLLLLAVLALSHYTVSANIIDSNADFEESSDDLESLAGTLQGSNTVQKLQTFLKHFQTFMEQVNHVNTSAIPVLKNYVNRDFYPACEACKATVTAGRLFLENPSMKDFAYPIAVKVCDKLVTKSYGNDSICPGMIDRFIQVTIDDYAVDYFRPHFTCNKLEYCAPDFEYEDVNAWINSTLADKPQKEMAVATGDSTYQMLHITDMHIDLGYVAGNNKLCGTPLCCRYTDGPAPNVSAAAGYWGNTGDEINCDIPLRTALQAMSFLEDKEIELIVWTGDNIGHNDWNQEMSTQFENTKLLAKAFQQHIPNAKIIGVPGNHECFPVNQCAFGGELFQWMNEQLAEAYADLLSEGSL